MEVVEISFISLKKRKKKFLATQKQQLELMDHFNFYDQMKMQLAAQHTRVCFLIENYHFNS